MSGPELDLAVSACRGLRFSRRLARCMNAAPISAKTGPDHGNVKTSGLRENPEIQPRDGFLGSALPVCNSRRVAPVPRVRLIP
jgi:hypothetical protein